MATSERSEWPPRPAIAFFYLPYLVNDYDDESANTELRFQNFEQRRSALDFAAGIFAFDCDAAGRGGARGPRLGSKKFIVISILMKNNRRDCSRAATALATQIA